MNTDRCFPLTASRLLALVVACAIVQFAALGTVEAEDSVVDDASQLIASGKYDAAIDMLNGYLEKTADDGIAWTTLANAYHSKGDYEAAARTNRKAAEFEYVRATAKYNEACALSLMGHVEEAHEALEAAIAAGFLNFDLMETDTDLAALRKKHDIPMPPGHTYESFKAHNGLMLGYKVLLPKDFDKSETYPALVFFSPGDGRRSADWAVSELMSEKDDTQGWIVIFPVGPDRGWINHPAHHALNDLLDELKKDYKVEGGKFHIAGFEYGARVATTWSNMSREYFQSLTTFSGWHWRTWLDDDLGDAFRDMPVRLVVGGRDEFGVDLNEEINDKMKAGGVDVKLTVIDSDDRMMASVRHGRIVEFVPGKGDKRASR